MTVDIALSEKVYGAIELGGTKIVCGIGVNPEHLLQTVRIDTTTPEENIASIIQFFQGCESQFGRMTSLGVASFGPIDINQTSHQYGTFLKTPKAGWSGFALRKKLGEAFAIPIHVTTDVNGALLAEHAFGALQGLDDAVYITIGTGVGGGVLTNGRLVNGFLHPELGHMRIPTGGVTGICPFHGNCVEGLVSGPAIAARAEAPAHTLSSDHPIWDEVSRNMADMCVNLITVLATKRIVLGGGVMHSTGLLEKIQVEVEARLAGYLPLNEKVGVLSTMLVPPALGDASGLIGAHLVAQGRGL